jgi:hypothetical protein
VSVAGWRSRVERWHEAGERNAEINSRSPVMLLLVALVVTLTVTAAFTGLARGQVEFGVTCLLLDALLVARIVSARARPARNRRPRP